MTTLRSEIRVADADPEAADPEAADLESRLVAIVRADPGIMALLGVLRDLDLPQWRLTSGAIYQTVWNALTGTPRGTGIKDYDVVYFDAADPSWEAEDAVIRRVAAATAGIADDLVGPVEVRNQARVHLWFERRFGFAYAPLASADESLTRYASKTHAVAVRLEADDRIDVVAPFGLRDIFGLIIRPNHVGDNRATHVAKAERARAIWPGITIVPW